MIGSSSSSRARSIVLCVLAAQWLLLPLGATRAQTAATVSINAASVINPVSDIGIGLHTSVYGNQFANPLLPTRVADSGVELLRYPGGSYSDIYQWSTHSSNKGGYVSTASHFPNFVNLMNGSGAKAGMVTVNYGDSQQGTMGGQPKEAAAWVAYANANAGIYGTANDVTLGTDAEGNNWYTAGYWARLRSSTVSQYRTWSQAAGTYNAAHEFLAMNRSAPVGIKYWEVGNEIGGNGYFGPQWEFDLHAPYNNGNTSDNTGRFGNALLSPTAYANNYNQFATLMKQVDPTIKIGAGLDGADTAGNHSILSISGANIDFGIVHWYPNGTNSQIMNAPKNQLPTIMNTIKTQFGTYAGKSPSQYELHLTEFGYGTTSPQGTWDSMFTTDAYLTGQEQGIKSMEYLEMSRDTYVNDTSGLVRGNAYYAIQMTSKVAGAGGDLVSTTSTLSSLRTHAVRLADGGLGIMLINEAEGNITADALATINISGMGVANTAQYYEYGWDNVAAGVGPTTQVLTGLGNSFTVRVPDVTMVALVFAPVPEPSGALLALAGTMLMVRQRRRGMISH